MIDPAFAASIESILRRKGWRTPACLDSRLPSEKSQRPRDLIMNIISELSEATCRPSPSDEPACFVPLKRSSRLEAKPSYPDRLMACFASPSSDPSPFQFSSTARHGVGHSPKTASRDLILDDDASSIDIPSYRYTHEASAFIRKI